MRPHKLWLSPVSYIVMRQVDIINFIPERQVITKYIVNYRNYQKLNLYISCYICIDYNP